MQHRLQFGMRENPASDRRHGSRPSVAPLPHEGHIEKEKKQAPQLSDNHDRALCATASLHAAPYQTVTRQERMDDAPLMTVHEVAELLQVPSSWVYEHTRRRAANRIPGVRLGKYWRFQREDIIRWIDTNRRKDYQLAG